MSDARFAVVLACFVVAFTILGYQVRSNSQNAEDIARVAYQQCVDVNTLKTITRRALESAIDRARSALPDAAARRSIAAIQEQIDALDGLRDCNVP